MNHRHPIQWLTAAPLWPGAAAPPESPALLRFTSDTFMDDLAALLGHEPARLADQVARPESFRVAPTGADPATWAPVPEGGGLKLYQPVHGQFALVAASLVCRLPGLPDRAVKRPAETVGFVLRRLDDQGHEMAWVTTGVRSWQGVAGRERYVAEGEEVLPLFPVPYTKGTRRTLHVGLIPTSSRETFQAAPRLSPFATEGDPRLDEFDQRIAEPLKALRASGGKASDAAAQVESSMFLLLDFADFLRKNAAALGDLVEGTGGGDLRTALSAALAPTDWLGAIRQAWAQRDRITGEAQGDVSPAYNLATSGTAFDPDAFHNLLATALHNVPVPAASGGVVVPKLAANAETRYVVRCVYRRPGCRPPHPDAVSEASGSFAIAPYFDADAPARPIRIPLPADTSIKGLRKFARNVGFLTSAKLRQQIKSLMNADKTIKGELSSGATFDLGEICSFSIPILTICAMVVLMIFVILLNIAFWWLPFFRLCFPVKKGTV